MKLVEYIAEGIRYATKETGLKSWDWDKALVVVSTLEMEGKEIILGFPVYVVPQLAWTFQIIFPWDHDSKEEEAMEAVMQYQELYQITEETE